MDIAEVQTSRAASEMDCAWVVRPWRRWMDMHSRGANRAANEIDCVS